MTVPGICSEPVRERATALLVLTFDCAALAVLSLVPLARPLGLADVDVPVSAVAGWFLLVAPLSLAVATLLGHLLDVARLKFAVVAQSAFAACVLAGLLTGSMAIGAELPVGDDAVRMRGLAIAGAALFAMNLLVLWRPAFAPHPR